MACLRIFAPGPLHVREHHRGPAEHIIPEFHTVIDAHVILDLTVAPDGDARRNVNILPDVAAFADVCAGADVGIVPDFRARTDLCAIIDTGAGMHKILLLFFHALSQILPGEFRAALPRRKRPGTGDRAVLFSYTDLLYPARED